MLLRLLIDTPSGLVPIPAGGLDLNLDHAPIHIVGSDSENVSPFQTIAGQCCPPPETSKDETDPMLARRLDQLGVAHEASLPYIAAATGTHIDGPSGMGSFMVTSSSRVLEFHGFRVPARFA